MMVVAVTSRKNTRSFMAILPSLVFGSRVFDEPLRMRNDSGRASLFPAYVQLHFLVFVQPELSEVARPKIGRGSRAAENGADMWMIFPRDLAELQQAPKLSRIPLVYVVSRGNRDSRPVATAAQLADMGYKIALDALLELLVSFHFNKRALEELKATGDFTGLSHKDCVTARHDIESLVGLDEFYAIEEETVEDKKWGER